MQNAVNSHSHAGMGQQPETELTLLLISDCMRAIDRRCGDGVSAARESGLPGPNSPPSMACSMDERISESGESSTIVGLATLDRRTRSLQGSADSRLLIFQKASPAAWNQVQVHPFKHIPIKAPCQCLRYRPAGESPARLLAQIA